ncbi:hypothetical protein KI387_027792, partial [Taxus chinensis]
EQIPTLVLSQAMAIQIEENLLISSELRQEPSKSKASTSSWATSSDAAFQKM